MNSSSYRDLEVWQLAMDLVTNCYKTTRQFPKSEIYGLTNQLQRAAVSIPANIAEGQSRKHRAEFLQFLSIACGSLAELETHILIAVRLEYLPEQDANSLLAQCARIGKMLNGLQNALKPITDNR